MELAFDGKVMLNLWVKVKGGWADDDRALSLGIWTSGCHGMNSRSCCIGLRPHRRPFRNTSLLVDLFTLDFGLIRAVAKERDVRKSDLELCFSCFSPCWFR